MPYQNSVYVGPGRELAWRTARPTAAVYVAICGALFVFTASRPVGAEPAHLWISESNILPSGPEAPTIPGIEGSNRFLHIWAQPMTMSAGQFHPTANPYRVLQNFSLNLVANDSLVEFVDDSIVVYNPQLNPTKRRFEFVHDSSTLLTSEAGLPDKIRGIQGFSISGGSGFAGIGGSGCDANDPYCALTPSSSPAWLVASVATRAIAPAGPTSTYSLQIGANGMIHEGQGSADTQVIFGFDPSGDPEYNAATEREITKADDAPDFGIQPTPASSIQEKHWLGGSGQWSDANWSNGGAPPSWTNNAFLDANLGAEVVSLTAAQEANLTTVNGGRLHINPASSLASDLVVSSGGAVSGQGWVGANLTLRGNIALTSANPLFVAGEADIAGGMIGLTASYMQAPNTVSAPFVLLNAQGGIDGTLATTVGASLGRGLSLESISYGLKTITIQIRSMALLGDYNQNGVVDSADYVVWRNTLGQPVTPGSGADGSNNGTIDAEDYNIWRARFGTMSGSGAAIGAANVPEPATGLLVSLCLCGLINRRRSHRACIRPIPHCSPL